MLDLKNKDVMYNGFIRNKVILISV